MFARLIPLPLHGAIEFVVGFVVALAPFSLGATAATSTIAFVTGVILMGTALGATISDAPGRRFSATWHAAVDRGIAAFVVLLAFAALLAGDLAAGTVILGTGVFHTVLIGLTRYSGGPTRLPAQIK